METEPPPKPGSKTPEGRARQGNRGVSKSKLRQIRAERTTLCGDLLACGQPEHAVRQVIVARYGCHWSTADADIHRAREALLAETGEPAETHRARSHRFYRLAVRDAERWCDKVRAQERIDKLLGLELAQEGQGAAGTVNNTLVVNYHVVRPAHTALTTDALE